MTKRRPRRKTTRRVNFTNTAGFYQDAQGRTRPITKKNVGSALARGITIRRIVSKEGKKIVKNKPTDFLLPIKQRRSRDNWIAKITGTDPQYGLARTFLEPDEEVSIQIDGVGHRRALYKLEEGEMYEYNNEGDRKLRRVVNGELVAISKRKAKEYWTKIEKESAFSNVRGGNFDKAAAVAEEVGR